MSRRSTLGLLAVLPALWLAGCSTPPAADAPALPLFDRAGQPVASGALLTRLRAARFVLLGEVHDNAAHHRARAELLRALLADGRPTRVVFEQIDREHSAAIAALPAASVRDAEAVASAGQLDRAGWAWPLHRPLFEAALTGGASVGGGNLGRAEASAIVRGGAARLPGDLQHWFDTTRPEARWSAAQAEQMRREVDDGHCHALPPTMLEPMALAQRARDAVLAEAMLAAPAGGRVVLIAGNGHVRADLGVPHYLRSAGVAAQSIVAVGFIERGPAPEPGDAFDFYGVADPVARADPCAAFKPR